MDMMHSIRMRPTDGSTVEIALLIPIGGSAGIFAPSCEYCAQLAVEEINAAGGLLGRRMNLRVLDGSQPSNVVAAQIETLVTVGEIDAVVGWHLSVVRRAVAPRIAGRVPYVYTALYEGGEHTPGVFLTGETPDVQLLPAMRWLADERGVRRWSIVGNDYVWPRRTALAAHEYAQRVGAEICDELFVPLSTEHFTSAISRVLASRADGVLMLLVGADAARFNRAFADVGLDDSCARLSTLVDENTLLASGASGTRGLCSTAGYFESLATPESLAFGARYNARFGADAPPLNSPGQSCYEGIKLLAELIREAGSLAVGPLVRAGGRVEYEGARGTLHLNDGHVGQPIYLAEADGLHFALVSQLTA